MTLADSKIICLEFVSPLLELDLQNVEIQKGGFVLCFSYFGSGESSIWMKLESEGKNTEISIAFYDCLPKCQVFFRIDGKSFRFTQERTNRWIFICISLDHLNQEMSIGLANKVAFSHKIENSLIKLPVDVQKLYIWWENVFRGITVPDKFTLLNIHNNNRRVDRFQCGEPGDLYSWKVDGWTSMLGGKSLTLLTSKESTHQTCQGQSQVYALPELHFYDAMKKCSKIFGHLYFEDLAFQELVLLEENRNTKPHLSFFIPYTDEKDEGVYRNEYTGSTFINISEYFLLGEPNGGSSQSCLAWFLGGLWDTFCTEQKFSLCQIPKDEPNLVLRGLCLESQVERFYTSGNNNGKFIWKGNGYASIQYTEHWLLSNILNSVSAESKAKYESLVIGTNAWEIHNDNCGSEFYITNLSLRFDHLYIYKSNFK